MPNKMKCVFILIAICLCLSSCKSVSPKNKEEQSSSRTPMPPEQLWADYTASSETNELIIDDDEKHITREISAKCVIEPSETRKIKFDLNIPEVPEFTAYNYDFPRCGKYDISDIISVFFGERAKDFAPSEYSEDLYCNSTDIYDQSLALLEKETGKIYLVDGDAAAMNFFGDNMLNNPDNMGIDLTPQKALELCEKFLKDSDIINYKYDYTQYYGAIDDQFYLIRYTYELDSLPATSVISNGNGFCHISFYVDNNGIAMIKGYLFDKSSLNQKGRIDTAQIISPKEAVDLVAKQAALIRCGYNNPEFAKYYSNHGEGLLYVPICEMKLGYWFSEYDGIKLAWIFYVGENGVIDRGASFSIDAITGKVYNNI